MKTVPTRVARLLACLTLAAASAGSASCSKPKPPQLTPTEVMVRSVDMTGFDLSVKMDAFNPNGFELAIRSVAAHVIVGGTQDLGTLTTSTPVTLAANAHTPVDVPLHVTWNGASGLVGIATSRQPVPFAVEGTAAVGGETLNVEVPFKLQGIITPEQAAGAAAKGLQNLGLPAGLLPKVR